MSDARASSRPYILIVDDDDTFRERLARAFRTRGYDAGTACSHEDAVRSFQQRMPDLAVIDLRMPGGSGLETVRTLRELSGSAGVLVLTGYGSIANALEAVRLGATSYLSKPADADDILRALSPAAERDQAPVPTPSLARVEWEHIQRVLADCDGNLSEAARRLGIHRRSLQRKLQKYPPRG